MKTICALIGFIYLFSIIYLKKCDPKNNFFRKNKKLIYIILNIITFTQLLFIFIYHGWEVVGECSIFSINLYILSVMHDGFITEKEKEEKEND